MMTGDSSLFYEAYFFFVEGGFFDGVAVRLPSYLLASGQSESLDEGCLFF